MIAQSFLELPGEEKAIFSPRDIDVLVGILDKVKATAQVA